MEKAVNQGTAQGAQGAPEKKPEIVVFWLLRDTRCAICGDEMGKGRFLTFSQEQPACMECADMDHLVYLPSGDAALTRRAKKYSGLSAVVVRFSRSRNRYERQGLLVEEEALARAEEECLNDADLRAARRERAELRRLDGDEVVFSRFAEAIRRQYPGCPQEEAVRIARHAARRGSGRVGRTAAGRELAETAIRAAVIASIRHCHTAYDNLLMKGVERDEARVMVRDEVKRVLARWEA